MTMARKEREELMSYHKSRTQRHRTVHAILTLIILFVTAVSTALLVPPAWRALREKPSIPPAPTPVVKPAPVAKKQSLCGVWMSDTSQKTYSFICDSEKSFQINEIDSHGPNNTGTGTFTEEGEVKAELFVAQKGRTAHLHLHVSTDGQRITGRWVGNDPDKEAGTLAFHRLQAGS
jgi:hypothetical protein